MDILERAAQAGDVRKSLAHSKEPGFRSNREKKSIHSVGIVTVGLDLSIGEKYLAQHLTAAALGPLDEEAIS